MHSIASTGMLDKLLLAHTFPGTALKTFYQLLLGLTPLKLRSKLFISQLCDAIMPAGCYNSRLLVQTLLRTFCGMCADLPPGIDTGDLLPPPPPGGPTGRPPDSPRPPAQAPSQHQQRLRPQMSGWGPSAGPPGSEGSSRKREYGSAFPDQGMASNSQLHRMSFSAVQTWLQGKV